MAPQHTNGKGRRKLINTDFLKGRMLGGGIPGSSPPTFKKRAESTAQQSAAAEAPTAQAKEGTGVPGQLIHQKRAKIRSTRKAPTTKPPFKAPDTTKPQFVVPSAPPVKQQENLSLTNSASRTTAHTAETNRPAGNATSSTPAPTAASSAPAPTAASSTPAVKKQENPGPTNSASRTTAHTAETNRPAGNATSSTPAHTAASSAPAPTAASSAPAVKKQENPGPTNSASRTTAHTAETNRPAGNATSSTPAHTAASSAPAPTAASSTPAVKKQENPGPTNSASRTTAHTAETNRPAGNATSSTPAHTAASSAPAPTAASSAPAPTATSSPPAPAHTAASSAPAPTAASSAPAPTATSSPPAPAHTAASSAPAPTAASSAPAPTATSSPPAPAHTAASSTPAHTAETNRPAGNATSSTPAGNAAPYQTKSNKRTNKKRFQKSSKPKQTDTNMEVGNSQVTHPNIALVESEVTQQQLLGKLPGPIAETLEHVNPTEGKLETATIQRPPAPTRPAPKQPTDSASQTNSENTKPLQAGELVSEPKTAEATPIVIQAKGTIVKQTGTGRLVPKKEVTDTVVRTGEVVFSIVAASGTSEIAQELRTDEDNTLAENILKKLKKTKNNRVGMVALKQYLNDLNLNLPRLNETFLNKINSLKEQRIDTAADRKNFEQLKKDLQKYLEGGELLYKPNQRPTKKKRKINFKKITVEEIDTKQAKEIYRNKLRDFLPTLFESGAGKDTQDGLLTHCSPEKSQYNDQDQVEFIKVKGSTLFYDKEEKAILYFCEKEGILQLIKLQGVEWKLEGETNDMLKIARFEEILSSDKLKYSKPKLDQDLPYALHKQGFGVLIKSTQEMQKYPFDAHIIPRLIEEKVEDRYLKISTINRNNYIEFLNIQKTQLNDTMKDFQKKRKAAKERYDKQKAYISMIFQKVEDMKGKKITESQVMPMSKKIKKACIDEIRKQNKEVDETMLDALFNELFRNKPNAYNAYSVTNPNDQEKFLASYTQAHQKELEEINSSEAIKVSSHINAELEKMKSQHTSKPMTTAYKSRTQLQPREHHPSQLPSSSNTPSSPRKPGGKGA